MFLHHFADECLPRQWIGSSVPVIIDFLGVATTATNQDRDMLYCLFPFKSNGSVVLAEVSRGAFIKNAINGQWLSRVEELYQEILRIN